MESQTVSLIGYRLKKLMAQAAEGKDVTDSVRQILEAERNLRTQHLSSVVQKPKGLLSAHGLANSTGL